jgi:flagellar hook-associated protein 1 FlgK
MSISGALTVALSGLQASTNAAQIISGNVANAQTPGYTAKTVNMSEVTNGTSLGGVQITGYSRASDAVLSATLNNATSSASYYSTQSGYMTQVQALLDSSDNPPALSSALSNFQAAWSQFSASPSDNTLEKSVVSSAQALVQTIQSIGIATQTLETNVKNDLSTSVKTLNSDLAQVQVLNTQISTAIANNQPIVDLEDQRDTLVNQVSQYTNVTVLQRSNGQIALYTPGGSALLDGQAQTFSTNADGTGVVNAVGGDVSGILTGGTLQAQTDFLSSSGSAANGVSVIDKLNSQLQNFTNLFTNSDAVGGFANTYNSAATGSGELASSFFTVTNDPVTGMPDVSTLAVNAALVAGTSTVKAGSGTAVAAVFNATNAAINMTTTPPTTSATFTSTGMTTTNQTFSGIATAILSGFQQAANTINNLSSTATTQQTYYQTTLSSETGVNTDTELVNLTNWENSYAASAHVITTIQQMMQTLQNMVQ